MSVNVNQIAKVINTLYPESGASEWDNSGFQLNMNNETDEVLVCLDLTPDIIKEAAAKNCNFIVSHHPILFHPIKNINSDKYIDNLIIELIKNNISLYSAHTSADNAINGLNKALADILELTGIEFLEPIKHLKTYKISVVVPDEKADDIRNAIYGAGGGRYGKYKESSFTIPGYGEFVPIQGAKPYKGKLDKKEEIAELRIETIVESTYLPQVVEAVKAAHPYEEPVIDIFELVSNVNYFAGTGICGELPEDLKIGSVIDKLKISLKLENVRLKGDINNKVKIVAICGGAGGDLIHEAVKLGADLFITGEVKHNIYLENDINILELGHYESEKCFCEMVADSLQKACDSVKYKVIVRASEKERAPYTVY